MGDRAGLGALGDFRERRGLFGAQKDECEVDEPTVRKQCGGERQSEESREFRGQQRLAVGDQRGVEGKGMGSEAPPLTGCVTMGRSLHPHTPGSRNLAHGGYPCVPWDGPSYPPPSTWAGLDKL